MIVSFESDSSHGGKYSSSLRLQIGGLLSVFDGRRGAECPDDLGSISASVHLSGARAHLRMETALSSDSL